MRNIFDQYSLPENRLTHALACTLHNDRSLVRPFLEWAGVRQAPPVNQLQITEQQVPGVAISGDDEDGRGLPDICIFADDDWVTMIESKVQAGISTDQLRRHLATARRHNFSSPSLLLLCVDTPPLKMPQNCSARAWRDLYVWFRVQVSESPWAKVMTDYMETFESRMIAEEYSIRGTITMFDGLRFDDDNPYTYREAKRLIRLMGDELQQREDLLAIGVDPSGSRRPAIKGRGGNSVWDFLPLSASRGSTNFTAYPHLTMVFRHDLALAATTIPNSVQGGFRTRLTEFGEQGFLEVLADIERRTRPVLAKSKGAKCLIYASQRHFPSRRSNGIVDAKLEADLQTLFPRPGGKVKDQSEWIRAIYHVLRNKRSNIQMGLEVQLQYDCPAVRSRKVLDLFASSWIAMSPIVDFVLND